jgi:hypothetical protein
MAALAVFVMLLGLPIDVTWGLSAGVLIIAIFLVEVGQSRWTSAASSEGMVVASETKCWPAPSRMLPNSQITRKPDLGQERHSN